MKVFKRVNVFSRQ